MPVKGRGNNLANSYSNRCSALSNRTVWSRGSFRLRGVGGVIRRKPSSFALTAFLTPKFDFGVGDAPCSKALHHAVDT